MSLDVFSNDAAFGRPAGRRTATDDPLAYRAGPNARLLAVGVGVGEQVVTGRARYIARREQLAELKVGEIVMAQATAVDWEPALARAGGILVNDGGPMCHAVAAARRLGIPAVIAAGDGASPLWTGATVTLVAGPGQIGRVYQELSGEHPQPPRPVLAFL